MKHSYSPTRGCAVDLDDVGRLSQYGMLEEGGKFGLFEYKS